MGRIAQYRADVDAAREQYSQAIEHDPQGDAAQQAQRALARLEDAAQQQQA